MADLTDEQFEAAEARGREMLAMQPQAVAARYDAASGRVIVDLANGCTYAFPSELVQDLQGADSAAVEDIKVEGIGFDLHWPALMWISMCRRWSQAYLERAHG